MKDTPETITFLNRDSSGEGSDDWTMWTVNGNKVGVFNKCLTTHECKNFILCCRAFDWWDVKTIIFDGGSNIGGYAQFVADCLADSDYALHLFEPNYFHMVTPLHERFIDDPGVKVNLVALADKIGELEMNILRTQDSQQMVDEGISWVASPRSMAGITTARSPGSQDSRPRFKFNSRSITIDAYCTENNIPHIHWLKLDVEGYELHALRGAKSMLARGRVAGGQFEIGPDTSEIIEFLENLGYKLWVDVPNPSGYYQTARHTPPEGRPLESNFDPRNKVTNDLVFLKGNIPPHIFK